MLVLKSLIGLSARSASALLTRRYTDFTPPFTDINALIAGFIGDLANAQASPQKAFGYKRARGAILALERQLSDLVGGTRTVPKIAGIGPSTSRVILEVLDAGESRTVEAAVDASPKREDVLRRRALRTHFLSRAAVLHVLADRTLGGPSLSDYCGDFQMHSAWSDGNATVAELARSCAARGYRYAAVTDHSHGLKIAGGMSMEDAARQHAEIDRANAASRKRFRLIKGVEANIGKDGTLDLTPEEVERFELVLAAPHSALRIADDQTARMVRAVTTRGVRILAHPRGRVAGTRAGIVANWPLVFRAAAKAGVAIEIDGDPSRQDLDHTIARQALDAGCLFALDSDAHTTDQLVYTETAIAHARLAGIPPARILNCWPVKQLLDWLR